MKKIKFVKYNKTRREEFQLKTSIIEEDGGTYVEKTALRTEGIPHISAFTERYEKLKALNPRLKPVEPSISGDKYTARFPYLTGRTLAEELGTEIQNGKAPLEAIREAMNQVFDVGAEFIGPFKRTPEFDAVFGPADQEDQAYKVVNLDALFENMLVTEEGLFCLDYEWVFYFPVPVHFVQYRTLFYFYEKYQSILGYDGAEAFLQEFSIQPEMIPVYQSMEKNFQTYVHGENQKIFLENYMQETKNIADFARTDRELTQAKERMEQLYAQIREKDLMISKIQETQRLTDNHVANLDVIISDLRRENSSMAETLTYLNRHEALIFKVKRKLGAAFNRKFPKGTRRRKILSYCVSTVKHPVSSFKLYTTEEGRNLIEGDLKIGECYREHGKLVFPRTEAPTVSVIIPVYNQINYTYLCLASILKHTGDIDYEVIIADDVSTDATAELPKFAENVVICRNETNQGFLKNCNQAAAAAKGKYLMFLNNDTQVTEGWLSSLVKLIESDPSIGMAGSKLVYPSGRLQEAGGIIWEDGSGWNYGRMDDPEKPEYNYVKDVDYISGAAILLPADLWKQVGGFDQRFAPAYYEDVDLAFEVRKAGYRVVFQPLSVVIHFEGISNGTDVGGSGLKRYQVQNAAKFREKWKAELKKQCVNTGNPDPFLARERGIGKPIVLVIDHYVPAFDKDAGSRSIYQQLCMFLEKGYTVKFMGDNFLHEEPYSTALEQLGIEILYGPEYKTGIWDWFKKHGNDIDFVYLCRPHVTVRYIDFLKENTKVKIIYYGVDLHFLRERREYDLTGDEEKKEKSNYWKSIEMSLLYKADMSYYPSTLERDMIKQIDPQIPVKQIPVYAYQHFLTDIDQDFEKREGLLFVGGFAHPPNADAVLWFVKEVLPLIRARVQAVFYIVGSQTPDEIRQLAVSGGGIEVKGFISDEELAELYQSCRVSVVPLRFGAGVKGKVVEAVYNGMPTVTTPIGAEGIDGIEQAVLIRESAKDFADAVIELYQNTDLCRELSVKTQHFIRQNFSVDRIWEIVKDDFQINEDVYVK